MAGLVGNAHVDVCCVVQLLIYVSSDTIDISEQLINLSRKVKVHLYWDDISPSLNREKCKYPYASTLVRKYRFTVDNIAAVVVSIMQ